MGNDGGTIPRRDELVRMKKKKEKVRSRLQYLLKIFVSEIIMNSVFDLVSGN